MQAPFPRASTEAHQLKSRGDFMDSTEALNRLMDGNKRYMSGTLSAKDVGTRRNETKGGQHPFAIIVTCSDSRVVPEFMFDTNLGDIFIIRTAGNIIDKITLGSIEYGAEHLHTPLVVVVGHEKCGAVTAACSGGECSPNIAAIVKKLKKPVKKGKNEVERAVNENVKAVIREMRRKSEVIRKLEEEGKIKIVGMKYYFEDGRLEMVS